MTARFIPIFSALLLLFGGCAATDSRVAIDADARAERSLRAEQMAQARSAMTQEARRAAQSVDRPWLIGKAQPLARDVTLPPALRADVLTTALFTDRLTGGGNDLLAIAAGLHKATGILVEVAPDALLPRDLFLPRLSSENSTRSDPLPAQPIPASDLLSPGAGPLSPEQIDRLPPPRGTHDAKATARAASGNDAPAAAELGLERSAPLPRILDAVSLRYGTSWRYDDARAAIVLYRTETRTLTVRTLTIDSTLAARFGLAGSSGNTTGGFESSSNVTLEPGRRSLDAVVGKVQAMLTRAGTVSAGKKDDEQKLLGTNTLIVTDIPSVLNRVEELVARENRVLTRRVRLIFDEVTLSTTRDNEAGIDWNLVYTSAAAATGATLASPSTALGQAAGALGASAGSGQWSGSTAMIRALAEVGQIVRKTSVPLQTLNRRPVTHALRHMFTYIDNVQSTASPSSDGRGALPSVSVNQKSVTTGTILTLLPDAQDDGQILLSVAYDNTVAQPLKAISFGSGDNTIHIQQLNIDGTGAVQQIELRPGRPTLIAGFARDESQYTSRRLDRDVPMLLGGSDRTGDQQLMTVVIVTAHVEDML